MMHFALQFPAMLPVLAVTLMLAYRLMFCRIDAEEKRRSETMLVATLLAIPAEGLCVALTCFVSRLVPHKLDPFIFQIDRSLFGAPAFVIGRAMYSHHWLTLLLGMSYGVLNIALLILFGAYLWLRPWRESIQLLRTTTLLYFCAVPIYMLIPVCGPRYAFAGFPFAMPQHLVPHSILIQAPPNGIPSVHMATALLIVWFSRHWKIGSVLAILFLILTMLATLGSGEHYLVDLIVAIPYTAFVIWSDQDAAESETAASSTPNDYAYATKP